jgi:short-subunit dehydrogenase
MNIIDKTVVLTGAAGGIGSEIARQLDQLGAKLILVDLNEKELTSLIQQLSGEHKSLTLDIASEAGRSALKLYCSDLTEGIDILINSAGAMDFAFLEQQDSERLELVMQINVIMPILLSQALLPLLRKQSSHTTIINVGSTFGSIGYPGFSAYCTSKFALRGFTETLRRELSDSTVDVLYIAPRAAVTQLNTDAITQMNKELKNTMDPPEKVAKAVISALEKQKNVTYVGWPEKLFIRVNSLFPRLVDSALKKQLPVIRRFAQQNIRSN